MFHQCVGVWSTGHLRISKNNNKCYITLGSMSLFISKTADLPMKFKDAALRVVFFDLTFFIIVTTIGLNIVFGIIVDTFSELRDERVSYNKD